MSNDPLSDLFEQNPPAAVDPKTQAKHKQAAMEAFRLAQQQKKATSSQGFTETPRLTRKPQSARIYTMRFLQVKHWLGGIAASVLIVFGFFTFRPEPMPISTPDPAQAIAEERQIGQLHDAQLQDAQLKPATTQANATSDKKLEQTSAPEPKAFQNEADSIAEPIAQTAPSLHKEKQLVARAAPESQPQARSVTTANRKESLVTTASRPVNTAEAAAALRFSAQEASKQAVPEQRDRFSHQAENAIHKTAEMPVSTFSIDVDTASYSFVRRQLNRGVLPAQDAVRTEEMINYFNYAYPLPESKTAPFQPSITVTDSPWKSGNKLVHIGIKGYELQTTPNSNLVFLLDVSGSMNSQDKLPLVKQSMGLLLDNLKPTDTVAMVVYAGAAGTVLEPTQVKQKQTILAALERLQAGGSTAGGQGLALAYQLAEANFNPNAVNRVILATDGDFNVGITQDQRLEDFVESKREKGIYLSVLGFGEGNYQDALMQTLAQNGNGIAAYIDTLSEAQKVLVHQATSSLFPIANDVKIQVEFNPALVEEYRLIGYETRALNREDFNNDKVDAGDIGAGHSVTAIYEITPKGNNSALVDDLRYQQKDTTANAVGEGELGFLKLRYKLPGEQTSKLITTPILSQGVTPAPLQQEVAFATAVAGFAQILKNSHYVGNYSYDQVINLAQANKGADEYGYRTEFIQLVRQAKLAKAM